MDTIFGKLSELLEKLGGSVITNELKLGIIGGVLVIIFFLLAWAIASGSKVNGLRKKVIAANVRLATVGEINEENASKVYDAIKPLPEPITAGWGCFLEQRKNYPSDYIKVSDVLIRRDYNGRNTIGKAFFSIFSVLIWAVVAFATLGISTDISKVGVKDFTTNFSLVAQILCSVLIPVVFFIIFFFILRHIYTKQGKRLEMAFDSLLELLDSRVVIPEKEEEPAEESLEDIKAKVDTMLEGHMEDEGEVTAVTMPDTDDVTEPELPESDEEEEEEAEEVTEPEEDVAEPEEDVAEPKEEEVVTEEPVDVEEPTEEPTEEEPAVEEAPVNFADLTKEEEARMISVLPAIVLDTIEDPETTYGDLEEIAELIYKAKTEGFEDPEDQEILEDCLKALAEVYNP